MDTVTCYAVISFPYIAVYLTSSVTSYSGTVLGISTVSVEAYESLLWRRKEFNGSSYWGTSMFDVVAFVKQATRHLSNLIDSCTWSLFLVLDGMTDLFSSDLELIFTLFSICSGCLRATAAYANTMWVDDWIGKLGILRSSDQRCPCADKIMI